MAAQVFWTVFYSSWRPSQIGPTADFDGAAIPPPIFSMSLIILSLIQNLDSLVIIATQVVGENSYKKIIKK